MAFWRVIVIGILWLGFELRELEVCTGTEIDSLSFRNGFLLLFDEAGMVAVVMAVKPAEGFEPRTTDQANKRFHRHRRKWRVCLCKSRWLLAKKKIFKV